MIDVFAASRTGLTLATLRLDKAANEIAGVDPSVPGARDGSAGSAITGATGAPANGLGDLPSAILDLMSAEIAFRANVATLKTANEMLQSLYKAVD